VSGAHNTIVCARAGKDLVSSLASGLLTIGPRFGGALDGAAAQFSDAFDRGLSPREFIDSMRKKKMLIQVGSNTRVASVNHPTCLLFVTKTHALFLRFSSFMLFPFQGIGHKVKSLENPDMRVKIVKDFVHEHFKSHALFDFACEVEQLTSQKKSNLILNVDGAIAVAFVDLLRGCGAFTTEEATEYVSYGTLNGLFVLGRSMGFIAHFIDQKRLKQGLYRHPTDDISYLVNADLRM
jgi:ATP citrate (pro-S)-lyase